MLTRAEADGELERLLHEEVNRLPERYRAAIVLCDLGGRTHEQAARHLGWPVGTIKSRLAKARERLRSRLSRRGFGPDAGLLAAALRPGAATAPVPPALAASTARLAAQSLITRTVVSGSVATLATGVLRTMSTIHWLKIASVAVVVAVGVSGLPLLAQRAGPGAASAPPGDTRVFEVRRGTFKGSVVERGNVEASSTMDVFSQVEGNPTIIAIVPEGTVVKKGQPVCELDRSALRDQLVVQELAVKKAETAFTNAKLVRQIAEIAMVEYENGIYPQAEATIEGRIARNRGVIQRAESQMVRTQRAREERDELLAAKATPRTSADILADVDLDDRGEAAAERLERGKAALELEQRRLKVLKTFTREKTVKELRVAVEKAQAEESANEQTWRIAQTKENHLRHQIENCKLIAPGDGVIVYANDPNRSSARPQIEEGIAVRERQKVFSIVDFDGPYRVHVNIPEAIIHQIKYRQPVQIKVDTFPTEALAGKVENVAPLPNPRTSSDAGRKTYTVLVRIDKALRGLRPGMTARAEIFVDERNEVLSVPRQAARHEAGKDWVAAKRADGLFEWREVTLGAANAKTVEVTQGLESGESVAVNAGGLLAEDQRGKFAPPAERAKNQP